MLSIKPNTSVNRIRRNLGKSERQRKRESESRRRRLEKLARWISGQNCRVFYQQTGAKCRKADDNARHDMEIFVPTEEQPQTETDLEPSVWDFVFQKAELVHELGHVLYTDFEAMEEIVDRARDDDKAAVFKNLFNIVEDGAIEKQLASDFNVGNDLEIKNANLMNQGRVPDEVRFTEAIQVLLMDWAKYDTGKADALLDPRDDSFAFRDVEARQAVKYVLPELKEMYTDVLTEPSGRKRAERVWEFVDDIENELWEQGVHMMADPFAALFKALGFPDDANVYFVMPGEPPDDAEALEPDEDDVVIMLEPPTGSGDSDTSPSEDYGAVIEQDNGHDPAEGVIPWQKTVQSTNREMKVREGHSTVVETWNRGQRWAKKYKRAFKRALQNERRTKTRRNQRAGRPDTQALWKLGYGNGRVFEREDKPEEKDYNAVVVIDRSGSVKSYEIEHFEAAAIAATQALEDLGVNVAVLSADSDPWLEKPFEGEIDQYRSVLASGHSSGGTPLSSTLEVARDQLDRRGGERFIINITDGAPDNPDAYKKELAKATFPVLGIYVGNDPDKKGTKDLYNRIEWTDNEEETEEKVLRLIEGILV